MLLYQNNLKWGSVDDLTVSFFSCDTFLALSTPQSNFIPVQRGPTTQPWSSAGAESLSRTYYKQPDG